MLPTVKLLLNSRVDPNVAVDNSALKGHDFPCRPLATCVADPFAPAPAGCALAPHPLRPMSAGHVRVAHHSTSSRRFWKLGRTHHLLCNSSMVRRWQPTARLVAHVRARSSRASGTAARIGALREASVSASAKQST